MLTKSRLPPPYPSKRHLRQNGAGLREDMQANWIRAKQAAKKYVYERLLDLAVKMQPDETDELKEVSDSIDSSKSIPDFEASMPKASQKTTLPDFDLSITETPSIETKTIVRSETPIVRAETPIVRAETPIVRAETPIVRAETPIVRAETPIVRAETPIVRAETPIVREETPIVRAETPIVRAETPIVGQEKALPTSEIPLDELLKRQTVPIKLTGGGHRNEMGITKATLERCLGMIDECIKNL